MEVALYVRSNDHIAKLGKVGAEKQVSSADPGALRNSREGGLGGGHHITKKRPSVTQNR